jgi:MoxR-like ATPase
MIIKEAAMSEKEMVGTGRESAGRHFRSPRRRRPRHLRPGSVVERTLVALLAGGHALLVGVPGLAKTKLVETLGTVLGLDSAASSSRPT